MLNKRSGFVGPRGSYDPKGVTPWIFTKSSIIVLLKERRGCIGPRGRYDPKTIIFRTVLHLSFVAFFLNKKNYLCYTKQQICL